MGILNLGQKLIETPEKWRKMMSNLAKEKPSVKQKKLKTRPAGRAVNRRPLRTEAKFIRLRILACLKGQRDTIR